MTEKSAMERFMMNCVLGRSRYVSCFNKRLFFVLWPKMLFGPYGILAAVLRVATEKEKLRRHMASEGSSSYYTSIADTKKDSCYHGPPEQVVMMNTSVE